MNNAPLPSDLELTGEQIERLEMRIRRCVKRARTLAETLDTEAVMLAKRSIDGYDKLLQHKGEQVTALEEAEHRLGRMLRSLGAPEGRKGVRMALRAAPGQVEDAWQELEELLRRIQARNEANGRLIHQNLEHTRRMIDLVAGAHESSDEAIYGTDGGRNSAQRSRKITQA